MNRVRLTVFPAIRTVKASVACLLASSLCLSGCRPPQQTSAGAESIQQKTITVMSMFTGEQQVHFEQSLVPFEEETGIDVIYEGSQGFPQLIVERVENGVVHNG